ncbi:MAG: hypothetical protein N3C12_15805 [Candidatus Binatia bacterium]|nr:hypothetical protein [Candidatus Binatia bacterium]
MTDRYEEWRDFYAEKVRSWMSLDEIRAECGKLQTADATSPEVLLIHAMHALEELQKASSNIKAEVERLRTDGANAVRWAPSSAHWSEVLRDLFGPDARKGIDALETRWRKELERADKLAEALEEIRSRTCINEAMNPDPFALTAMLGDIHHITDAALPNGDGEMNDFRGALAK